MTVWADCAQVAIVGVASLIPLAEAWRVGWAEPATQIMLVREDVAAERAKAEIERIWRAGYEEIERNRRSTRP